MSAPRPQTSAPVLVALGLGATAPAPLPARPLPEARVVLRDVLADLAVGQYEIRRAVADARRAGGSS